MRRHGHAHTKPQKIHTHARINGSTRANAKLTRMQTDTNVQIFASATKMLTHAWNESTQFCVFPYAHANIQKRIYKHTQMHKCSQTRVNYSFEKKHTYRNRRVQTCKSKTHTHTHTHTHTLTHSLTLSHTLSHTHTHGISPPPSVRWTLSRPCRGLSVHVFRPALASLHMCLVYG
jgi:hypothetical protein